MSDQSFRHLSGKHNQKSHGEGGGGGKYAEAASDGKHYSVGDARSDGGRTKPAGAIKAALSKPGAELARYTSDLGDGKTGWLVKTEFEMSREGDKNYETYQTKAFVQQGTGRSAKVTEVSRSELNRLEGGKVTDKPTKPTSRREIQGPTPEAWGAPLNRSSLLDSVLSGDVRVRAFPLDDLDVSGRTVTAYAAVFDTPARVVDHDGEYEEVLDRRSFARTIEHHARNGFAGLNVYYNHALTLHGTPSERFAVPIGRATDVKIDKRGVLTTSVYNDGQHANEVLASIRNGDITGQSFTGKFVQSDPARKRFGPKFSRRSDGSLRTVRRLEVAMREYGPTPIPVYEDARILGVRSIIDRLPEDERARALEYLGEHGTPTGPADDSDSQTHSAVMAEAVRLRAQLRMRGILG